MFFYCSWTAVSNGFYCSWTAVSTGFFLLQLDCSFNRVLLQLDCSFKVSTVCFFVLQLDLTAVGRSFKRCLFTAVFILFLLQLDCSFKRGYSKNYSLDQFLQVLFYVLCIMIISKIFEKLEKTNARENSVKRP